CCEPPPYPAGIPGRHACTATGPWLRSAARRPAFACNRGNGFCDHSVRGRHMKLSLVVASGVHEGKAIPITTPQFVIGRDEQCQLRPASPAISKRHCALMVRGGQVFVRDFGSTNGTFVNGQLVEGEVELFDQDLLKVGPLEFRVGMEVSTVMSKPAA